MNQRTRHAFVSFNPPTVRAICRREYEGQGYMCKEIEIEREERKRPSEAEIVVSVLIPLLESAPSLDISSFVGCKLRAKGQTSLI